MVIKLARTTVNFSPLRRLLSFLTSVGLHAAVIAVLWLTPPFPDFPSSRHVRLLAETTPPITKSHTIIWLRRNQRLPDISPAPVRQTATTAPTPASKPAIQASPPNATHTDQFIYVPRPKPVEQQAFPSPDVVMVRKFSPPAPPAGQPRATQLSEPAIAPPQTTTPAANAALRPEFALPAAPKPEYRKFSAPADTPRRPTTRLLEEPDAPATSPTNVSNLKVSLPSGQLASAPKPPPRAFTAPPSLSERGGGGGASGGNAPSLAEPDLASPTGVPGEISAVILSANPLANGKVLPPESNRNARINTGSGSGTPGGSGSGGAPGSTLVVPNLTVHGGGGASASGAIATAPSAPSPAVTPTRPPPYRHALNTPSVSVPLFPTSRHVPARVDASFANRIVYCTVMPGPINLRDWVIWFGETAPPPAAGRPMMRPPVARITALSPPAAGGAPKSKIWIAARLGADGRLSGISLPPGIAAPQASELLADMSRWLFTPAIQNGQAVAVDVLLEADFYAPGR